MDGRSNNGHCDMNASFKRITYPRSNYFRDVMSPNAEENYTIPAKDVDIGLSPQTLSEVQIARASAPGQEDH